jgi:hypothetical protein
MNEDNARSFCDNESNSPMVELAIKQFNLLISDLKPFKFPKILNIN